MGDTTAARAARRTARIVLGVALASAAVTGVLLAGRPLGPREENLTGPGDERAVSAAGSTPATQGGDAARATAAPAAVHAASQPAPAPPAGAWRDDGSAGGHGRWDTTSLDTGDWRDSVAAAQGRAAVQDAPLDAGALHTHLAPTDVALPETRAPVVGTPRFASTTETELFGWDGGEFWFGPQGLVRVREAAR